ncbi:hypothetical protein BpHYR1_014798 [Brachionus plicatilis]|uniref:RNA-directed DNA polymerase from mobile element jockey-like n=1 Tax=Brachionus plicatilis TaxID=10195 RepID=A0A3M7SST4_BRAPC|nr:hypothetical protein BpHYR1_014798 [Brachionus plicatilis]
MGPEVKYRKNSVCVIKKTLNPTLLGIKLDPGLTFKPHLENILKLDLLKILSSRNYSLNFKHLITVNKLVVMSLIQYSMIPFIACNETIKKSFQPSYYS